MIIHGRRSFLSICNTVHLFNLLYKKTLLVSCLSYVGLDFNFMPHNSLTLSRALPPPHICAVVVLSLPLSN